MVANQTALQQGRYGEATETMFLALLSKGEKDFGPGRGTAASTRCSITIPRASGVSSALVVFWVRGQGRSSKRLNARANLAFSQGHSATSQWIFLLH